jgi:hypothetical protein
MQVYGCKKGGIAPVASLSMRTRSSLALPITCWLASCPLHDAKIRLRMICYGFRVLFLQCQRASGEFSSSEKT